MARIAVIGLGLMGGILADHLRSEGHEVVGYDPEAERRDEFVERGGRSVTSEAAAVAESDIAVLSLPNSHVSKDVCFGPVLDTASEGYLVIDTTTGQPQHALEIAAALAEQGIGYVDGTISGNAAQARVRDTVFMLGGADDDVAAARGLLQPLGRSAYAVGPTGSGARAKLIVNHVLGINRTALAEALTVAEKAGIDLSGMLEILRDSAAFSKAMDIWGERMVAGDHDPPTSRVRQSHKDSRLILAQAEEVGASSTFATAVERALEEAEQGGLSDADNSSIMEVMRRRADIGRIPSE
jgi:3-hydroxyisobutyrate dehydrogenase-like beta-hydroxyacid dehydrogenase